MSEIPSVINVPARVMQESYKAGDYPGVIKHGRAIVRLVGINQQDKRINDQEAEDILGSVFKPLKDDPKLWQAWWKELQSNVEGEADPVLMSTFYVGVALMQARLLGVSGPEGIPSVNPVLEQIAAKYGLPINPDIKTLMHTEARPNPNYKRTTSEAVAATATQEKQPDPLEERAERLVKSISYAEFGSFQEYTYVANRNGGWLDFVSINYGSYQGIREDDDIVQKQENSDRTIATVYGLMIYNHIPLPINSSSTRIPYGSLFCVIGKKDGQFIVQGAGTIHRDQVKRPNDSSFKLVFTSKTEFDDFVDWLKESPSEALSLTVQKLIENSRQKPLSPESGRGLLNVYSKLRWIGKLSIANVDTQETVVKDFKEPFLHQQRIDMVKDAIGLYGTLQEARNVYQKRTTQDSDRNVKEAAEWMLSIMDAYETEYGQPASHIGSLPAAEGISVSHPRGDIASHPSQAESIHLELPDPRVARATQLPATPRIIGLGEIPPEELARIIGAPPPPVVNRQRVTEITDTHRDVMEQLGEILASSEDVVTVEFAPEILRQYLLQQSLPENVRSIKSSSVELYLDKDRGNALRAEIALVAKTPIGDKEISFDGIIVNNPQGGIIAVEARHHGIPPGFGRDQKKAVEEFKKNPNGVIGEAIDDQIQERFPLTGRRFRGARIETDSLQISFKKMTIREAIEHRAEWIEKKVNMMAAKKRISKQEALRRLQSGEF